MNDREFLIWIAERLEHIYGEPHNVDFLHRLRAVAGRQPVPVDTEVVVPRVPALDQRWLPVTATQRTLVEWQEVPEFAGISADLLSMSPYINRSDRYVTMKFAQGTLVWFVHRDDLDFGREMALELVGVKI